MSAAAPLRAGTSAPLRIQGLALVRGGRQVLRGVDLTVGAGERVALMSLSGGGKTTVLRAVVALEPFDAGRIEVDGFALLPGPLPRERHLAPLRRRVGMVFQSHSLFEHLSALDNVALAPVHAQRLPRAEAVARAAELLATLGAGHRASALPRELSGGEAQRVAIARALAVDPPLLLLDEPTAALDPARRGELATLLLGLAAQGRTLLLTTHDVDFARQLASRVVVLADGQIVEQGPPEEVLDRPQHPATRRLLQSERERGATPPP